MLLLYFQLITANADEIVIINNDTTKQATINRFVLRSSFMMKPSYWDNGTPIIPVYIDFDNDVHKMFVSSILRVSPINFDIVFRDKVQSGELSRYIVVDNIVDAIQKVRTIPGAVAYAPSTYIIVNSPQIRIVRVIE